MFFEMHRHTQYSMFDGFDKIKNIVAYARELGMPAIGISDHGNACGILELYYSCKKINDEAGETVIKPLMGCEVYFQPVFNSQKPRYHLCLYAINETGYRNLTQILSEANAQNFYRYGHVTFDILENNSDGIVCTTACVAGFIQRAIVANKKSLAIKAIKRFKRIFGDNFYFEIMPIKIDNKGTQEHVNRILMKLGKKFGIKCILTTDAHFTRPEDFDSYLMMHRMSKIGSKKGEGFTIEHIEQTYRERHMHSKEEIAKKFKKMHGYYPTEFFKNMEELYNKINIELDFSDSIPIFDEVDDGYRTIKEICLKKLKDTGRYNKQYVERLKYEMSVIKKHDLCDYFLIVRDYVRWALDNGHYVGPGRGSVCGSLVAELLDITKVDPIDLGTDFDRFLRPDKKKMPDIDLDFDSEGQKAVIEYILDKYKGRSAQLLTFGFYKRANLINDLCKVYKVTDNSEIAEMKKLAEKYVGDVEHFNMDKAMFDDMMKDATVKYYNKKYKGIFTHFTKLYGHVKYYGRHPGGVIVTRGPISQYTPMMRIRGELISGFDRYMVDESGMLKFDVLAVKTLTVNKEIETITGDYFDRRKITPAIKHKMFEYFKEGKTNGIFQLGSDIAKEVMRCIQADTIQDVIAAVSLNRPGTLKLKMHEVYAANKQNPDKSVPWYEYVADTHGTIIYQEHIMRICRGIAGIPVNDVDKLIKGRYTNEYITQLEPRFVKGAKKVSGLSESEAKHLFEALKLYMFNKGHGAGYALVSEWQMYHKVKHPTVFWFATMKHEHDDRKKAQFMQEAALEGIVFFLPHVNYTADYSLRKFDGEWVVQQGTKIIKNVGEKAAKVIEDERKANGPYRSLDDFLNRVPKRTVNARVVESLIKDGALEFNKKIYLNRTIKFNSTLYMKGLRG